MTSQKEAFASGSATTAFIGENYSDADLAAKSPGVEHLLAAACLQYRAAQAQTQSAATATSRQLAGFRSNNPVDAHYSYADGDATRDVVVRELTPGNYRITADGREHSMRVIAEENHSARLVIDAVQKNVSYAHTARGEIAVQVNGVAQVLTNQLAFTKGDESAIGGGAVVAPMHGNVLEVLVAVGDSVAKGQTLAIMEAMKMEHRLTAEIDGVVAAVHASAGVQLAAGALVLEIGADLIREQV